MLDHDTERRNVLWGWALFALAGYSRMLGDYADSPIVSSAGSKNQWAGAVGIGYTF
jgi:outer membrane scaffolding protein for murein synthesis (MipA/OmpV family)